MTLSMRAAVVLCAAVVLVACSPAAAPATPSAPAAPASTPRTTPVDGSAERLVPNAVAARPAQPGMAPRYRAALVPDPCVDRDLAAPPATDVVLNVLDRTYALPAAYVPPDLVPAADAGLKGASASKLVRVIVLDDLEAMRAGWEAAGLSIEIESAYRSFANQAATFDLWVARIGYPAALLRSARAGHSEHQLGTAIDVTSAGWSGRVGDWAAESAEGAWMASHAWEYGFVMSYPADSIDATCFGYEPWHYRWIGREPAARHRAGGLDLRQFLERYATG